MALILDDANDNTKLLL